MDGKGIAQLSKPNNGKKMLHGIISIEDCLSKCREVKDATGCEFLQGVKQSDSEGICIGHTQELKSGSGQGDGWVKCFVFSG